tara:strand:+ start:1347 stop:2174 length:828 start_codon:yes stop_codon:yes gene_type:complete
MKKVVKISEKKLINFIKKSLNEYNNKIINKTNIVLNEQDNNDGWTTVEDQEEFDSLKEQGLFEFKRGISPDSALAVKTTTFRDIPATGIHTYYRKIVTPEEKVKLKKEQARQKSIEDAWQAVQIYGQENDLRVRAEFDTEDNQRNYYLINGVKYYNDGWKVNGSDKKRYSEYDDIFENSPDDKINWTKKFPCIENYADENDGERDSKTNYYTIKNVIYKPTGKKSKDNGQTWVDFYCSDAELKNYIEPKKVTEPVKVKPQDKEDIPEPIINKYKF